MSVTITSYKAPSILRLAASPEFTVSMRWPSRRRAMSSTSQMERSSSQIRMLPMEPTPSHGRLGRTRLAFSRCGCRYCERACGSLSRRRPPEVEREFGALPRVRADRDLASVRLHDLVHNGQAQTRSALKTRLERLKHLLP